MLYYLQSQAVSGRREGITMAIDITNQEALKKLTIYDLLNDAAERGDEKALDWLEEQTKIEETRTNTKTGKTYTVPKGIVSIRAEYIRDYLGYKPKKPTNNAAKEAKKAKRQKEMADAIAAARKKLAKNK